MIRSLLALLLLVPRQEPPLVAKEDPLSPQEQHKRFKLPPGFEIQLVASEPDIAKPMNLAFDDRGRLFVTSSVEYPFPAREGLTPRDSVKILDDFATDGRARRVRTFVDALNIPIGVVATPDGVICHGIPKIWRATDADGDGKAEARRILYGDIGFQDTHGMANAFHPWVDGWIYACHGFANKSTVKSATTASEIFMHSGNTWRFKADGSAVEYYSHGQVNPFGLCFDPLGNLYSADCHSKPIYHLLRGAWYPTFDGAHDGLGHAPDVMAHLHGSTAIGGIVYYAATQFPAAYRDTIFVGNPVTGCVNHDKLEKTGTSQRAIAQPDFLRCDDRWFRPVDLKLAPDGSLYIADFYNRIIGHYEVPLTHPGRDRERGRIWRVVYKGEGATVKPMADLFKTSSGDLAALLNDGNLQVRVRATNQLANRADGAEAVAAIHDPQPWQRAHGLWVLERKGVLDEARVRKLIGAGESIVRVHVLKAISERKAWTYEATLVRDRLADGDPYVRRAAAEALGLHPARENIKPLLDLWTATPANDTHLVYMARMTLRNQLLEPAAYDELAKLAGGDAAALKKLADVSLGVKNPESARFVLSWMKGEKLDSGQLSKLLQYVTRYVKPELLTGVFEYARTLESRPPREQLSFVRAAHQGCQERGTAPPESIAAWARNAVASALKTEDRSLCTEAIKLCRDLKLSHAYDEVEQLALGAKHQDLRIAGIDALPALNPKKAVAALARILGGASEPAPVRQKAIAGLASVNSPEARAELLNLLKTAPQSMAAQIAAGLAATLEGGEALLNAITEGKASPRLLVDRAVDVRLRATRSNELVARLEKLTKDLPPEDERIKNLMQSRKSGFAGASPNPTRGAEIFKKACSGCHKLDGIGNKVGPELDGVFSRGVDRLLEDILDPNRNVDQAFRATLLKTTDGRVLSGLALREEGQVLVLQEAVDKETRVSLKDIEARQLSQLSAMPSNIGDPLPESDFYDLLSYLLQPRTQK